MKGLSATILYALPITSLPLFVILLLYSPFAVIGQSDMPPIFNSTQTANNATNNTTENNTAGIELEEAAEDDIFGISKIYPTKVGAREWFLNMSDPKNSLNFSITDNLNLSKLSDGSWRINASHVRMVVNTSDGQEKWKNVEITGYVRLSQLTNWNVSDTEISNSLSELNEDEIDDLVFISRSGRHSSEVPCEGTAYNAGLYTDGSVGWKKEIWHTGGYTEER